jgi:oligosaccharide repeat unit polymerase
MSLLLVTISALLGILLGRLFFKKWFNHLTLYSAIMGGLVFFYELKLLPYPDLIPQAWFMLVATFLAFILGTTTVLTAKNLYGNKQLIISETSLNLKIFSDGGKALKYSILLFSFIGLFVALHRWFILIGKFGSIQDVIINAAVVYRLNVQGEIKEFIPILPSFVYVGVFLSGIYTAYKGRFSFLSFFPVLTIILKELTYFGRGEMLFSSMEFLFTFILFRHLLASDLKQRFKFSKGNAFAASVIFLSLLIVASSFVRVSRSAIENYSGANSKLRNLKDNFLFSPSVYLYLSSDVGVLSKYLQLDKEETHFGQNTFHPVYDLLSKFKVIEKPNFFQKGYFIPMWTNTGTFIREIHADFGIVGVLMLPYILGMLITWFWFRFYNDKSIYDLLFLVYLFIIVGFSFLMMITRLNIWLFSQVIILMYVPILNRLSSYKNSKIYLRNAENNFRTISGN